MYYEEVPSNESLCLKEANRFLREVLKELNYSNISNISKFMFQNEIPDVDKRKILAKIEEKLNKKLESKGLKRYFNYDGRKNEDLKSLCNSDTFIRYYCLMYDYMKLSPGSYSKCCLAKTKEELQKELKDQQEELSRKMDERHRQKEEEEFKEIYICNFSNQNEYSYKQLKYKWLLGKSYNNAAVDCCLKLAKARDNYDFNKIDIYEGRLYSIIVNALQSDCIDFDYELFWQKFNDFLPINMFGFCELTTVSATDIKCLRIMMVKYHSEKEYKGYCADLKTSKIYEEVYEAYTPYDSNTTSGVEKTKYKQYPHMFYM